MINISEQIKANNIRAGLIITNEKKDGLFHNMDLFISSHLKSNPKSKVCLIDLDLFENAIELEFPESLRYDNFLRIALRKNAYNYVHKNDMQFAFYTPPTNYIICEMHLIYLFERFFFEIISDFEPTLIVCLSGSNFSRNSKSDNFILSGDCNFLYYHDFLKWLINVISYLLYG